MADEADTNKEYEIKVEGDRKCLDFKYDDKPTGQSMAAAVRAEFPGIIVDASDITKVSQLTEYVKVITSPTYVRICLYDKDERR